MVSADNALLKQSNFHADGWGVAHYIDDVPHIIKSNNSAFEDSLFRQISGVVSSHTVLAHLRKATHGDLSIINSHPFQFGRWVFAHNGNIKYFEQHRTKLLRGIDHELKRYILGQTDSEILFYFLLSSIKREVHLQSLTSPHEEISQAIQRAISEVISIIGPLSLGVPGKNTENYLTFILTNGSSMFGYHGGQSLYYSTYKTKCSDRNTCASFSPECEAPSQDGHVNHLIFSSEPLEGENIWIELQMGDLISVDRKMNLVKDFF